ncbi:hypothetical protein F4777DRAFT_554209 [Nemania sp. FL0916]|nr:hypothetical protein F4777DRAFT_554209 [Nemania sp. FL0916]
MDYSEEQLTAAGKIRVSVACLSCRNRHVRCDAQQPVCIRCSSEGRTCEYVKSRRGGLSRARLAERRRARNGNGAAGGSPSDDTSPGSRSPGQGVECEDRHPGAGASTVPLGYSVLPTESETSDDREEQPYGTPLSMTDNIQFLSVANDFLIKLYYKHFHRCHPCVLPQQRLHQQYESTSEQGGSLALLIAIMRYVGSLYGCPDLTSQLRDKVIEGFQGTDRFVPDPFLVQCHLLYSIAVYWSGEKDKAREEIDAAIRIALNLGLHRREFVAEHEGTSAVVQESFRRTWWQLYCIDAYYAAIKRSPAFPLCEVDADTDLPCEEDEYESGSIPTPKTLDDFDSREFGPENQTFSSFAYLIGATRSIALVLAAGAPDASNWLSPKTIAEVDAIIDGWFLLLPKSKRDVFKEGNVVDELMFQAQMAIHANLIALHRPFSRLQFHPLEGISSCLVEPPQRLPVGDSSAETVHTQRCLQSIEAQLQLLVLPVQPLHRSPFTICMTAAGTHTLLAAIKVLFSGRRLAVGRHQLRLVVGYIRSLAKVWPQGGRNLEEIQAIAQEVLSGRRNASPKRIAPPEKDGASAQKQALVDAEPSIEGLDGWGNPAMAPGALESPSVYWNLNSDFQTDIPIWFSSY